VRDIIFSHPHTANGENMSIELNNVFNPFDVVQYQGRFPNSRTLHTSLYKKIIDTFKVLNGATYLFEKNHSTKKKLRLHIPFELETRPGLLDYATLGTFRLIHALASFFTRIMKLDANEDKYYLPYSKHQKTGIYLGKALAFLPWIVFRAAHVVTNGVIRYGISTILTAAFFPIFIAPAHGISKFVAWVKKNQIETDIPKINKNGPIANTYVKLTERLNEITVKGKNLTIDKHTEIRIPDYFSGKTAIHIKPRTQELWHRFCLKDKRNIDKLIEVNPNARALTLSLSRRRQD